jgi:hypothetical protein
MAQAYADLIMKGIKTMDDVPDRLKPEVQKILDEAGWTPPEEPTNN